MQLHRNAQYCNETGLEQLLYDTTSLLTDKRGFWVNSLSINNFNYTNILGTGNYELTVIYVN